MIMITDSMGSFTLSLIVQCTVQFTVQSKKIVQYQIQYSVPFIESIVLIKKVLEAGRKVSSRDEASSASEVGVGCLLKGEIFINFRCRVAGFKHNILI